MRASSHRDLHAPNRIFFRNTSSKIHGRRQPYRGFLSCLAEKPLVLECLAVLNGRFLLTEISRGRRNTECISRTMDLLWGKRFVQNHVNPYVRTPQHAHFYFISFSMALMGFSIAFAIEKKPASLGWTISTRPLSPTKRISSRPEIKKTLSSPAASASR